MHEKYDELTAFISGIIGGSVTIHIIGISWQDILSNVSNLLWIGFVALFTGGMGVLGKHIVTKILKRKK